MLDLGYSSAKLARWMGPPEKSSVSLHRIFYARRTGDYALSSAAKRTKSLEIEVRWSCRAWSARWAYLPASRRRSYEITARKV